MIYIGIIYIVYCKFIYYIITVYTLYGCVYILVFNLIYFNDSWYQSNQVSKVKTTTK